MILAFGIVILTLLCTLVVVKKECFEGPNLTELESDTQGNSYTSKDVIGVVNTHLKSLEESHSCISVKEAKRIGPYLRLICFLQNNVKATLVETEIVARIPMKEGAEYQIHSHSVMNSDANTLHGSGIETASYLNLHKD